MRSSVLAEEAISRGIECVFVGEISGLDWVSERIAKLGFSKVILSQDSFEANNESDVLVLDSYAIPVSDQFIARKNWRLVLVICDETTPQYESDVELRSGLVKVESKQGGPIVLSGTDYLLIRKGIGKSPRKTPTSSLMKILVVGGGSNTHRFVEAISDVLVSLNLNLEVHTFTNNVMPKNSNVRFVRHPIGPVLDLIANDVDVIFTTASTSSLEFIAREIPTGIACAVNNQMEYYEQLGSLGYAVPVGRYRSDGKWDLNVQAILELLESQEKQDSLRCSMQSLIDLKGASRVIDAVVSRAKISLD
jgi:spore coat polysaccharide biosynthesis predicted glycosyltransferase SpsG